MQGQALTTAFDKPEKDNEVLYYLPVTHSWIFQLILALILICHCSYRGIKELLRDLFDYSLSIGTIHNRVTETVQKARKINQTQDLSSIRVALQGRTLSEYSTRIDRSGCALLPTVFS